MNTLRAVLILISTADTFVATVAGMVGGAWLIARLASVQLSIAHARNRALWDREVD